MSSDNKVPLLQTSENEKNQDRNSVHSEKSKKSEERVNVSLNTNRNTDAAQSLNNIKN